MANFEEQKCYYGSATNYVMLLLGNSMGFTSALVHPNMAMTNGAIGHMVCYFLTFVLLGIPLLYMELTVSQFTARDCLDVWRARPCLSHIGYIQVMWQVVALIYNHAMVAFIVHYLLISFENPIPYIDCGPDAPKDCEISQNNFSVYRDCIKKFRAEPYCENLYTTYAEYNYWRFQFLGGVKSGINSFRIAWKATLGSALVCVLVYLNCFKRITSIRYFIRPLSCYPFVAYVLFFFISMSQKGLMTNSSEVFDTDFTLFWQKAKLSSIVQHVLFSMGLGTGVMFNLGSRSSFRAASYGTAVVATLVTALFSALTVTATATLSCPYASEFGMRTHTVMNNRLNMAFEKLPRIISQFDNRFLYLILLYSCLACLGISTDVVLFFTLTEMTTKRFQKLAKYPGLVNLVGLLILFLISIPWIGSFGINYMQAIYRHQLNLMSTFMCIFECVVFIFWYGFDRFSEDIHFMQGVQPKTYMKMGWILSVVVLTYVFCNELSSYSPFTNRGHPIGFLLLMLLVSSILAILLGKILVALCRNKFYDVIRLDSSWGPCCDVLQRSRAMFTSQAMTKEYLYRQYHLQAGIMARQRRSNVRVLSPPTPPTPRDLTSGPSATSTTADRHLP